MCSTLPSFNALTASNYNKAFSAIWKYSFIKRLSKPWNTDLLSTFTSQNVNVNDANNFVLGVTFNRSGREKSLGENCCNMLFMGKGKQTKFAAAKNIWPDEIWLSVRIFLCQLVGHGLANCFNPIYDSLDSLSESRRLGFVTFKNNLTVSGWVGLAYDR